MLFNLFSKKQAATRQGSAIQDKAQILAIVQQIASHRAPLTLSFNGIPQQFSSLILKVKAAEQHFLLDELYPAAGHRLLLERKRIQIHSNCQGIPVLFDSPLLAQGEHQGVAFYGLALPTSLLYQQRRQATRLALPHPNAFALMLKIPQQPIAQGSLNDLSMHGASAEFPGNLTPYLSTSGQVLTCMLRLSSTDSLSCSLRICNVKYQRQSHKTRVGGAFEGLDRAGSQRLNQWLLQIRRRQA